jgi:hypothetical protein
MEAKAKGRRHNMRVYATARLRTQTLVISLSIGQVVLRVSVSGLGVVLRMHRHGGSP